MNHIYYGCGSTVVGPYHPDEIRARARAQHALWATARGRQVYEIKAPSWEDARRRLARARGVTP